jgi:hypothetical protein
MTRHRKPAAAWKGTRFTLEDVAAAWKALSPEQREERLSAIGKQVEAARRRRERERVAFGRQRDHGLLEIDPVVEKKLFAAQHRVVETSRRNTDAGKKGGEARRQSAQDLRDRVERNALAAMAQLQRNGQEPSSRAALARAVASRLGKPFNTVKGILQELGIPKLRRPRR